MVYRLASMIIPVRCFTCGKVIGNKWTTFVEHQDRGMSLCESLDALGLKRYCCRRMLQTHVDHMDSLLTYESPPTKAVAES